MLKIQIDLNKIGIYLFNSTRNIIKLKKNIH